MVKLVVNICFDVVLIWSDSELIWLSNISIFQ